MKRIMLACCTVAMLVAAVVMGPGNSTTSNEQPAKDSPKNSVLLGYVAVIDGFVLSRTNDAGTNLYQARLLEVQKESKGKCEVLCVPVFPGDLTEAAMPKTKRIIDGLKKHVKHVQLIIMLDKDPQDPNNKAHTVATLRNGFNRATELGVEHVASTSFEAWMKGTEDKKPGLRGKELDETVKLLIEVHAEAVRLAKADGSKVKYLDMEYLRTIEFVTFTNAELAWRVIDGINARLGYVFVRLIDDSAHAGDSGLSVDRINEVRHKAGKAGAYGTFHLSEPTTRGRIGSGGTYAVDSLKHAGKHGSLSIVLAECFPFDHDDTDLMRKKIPGYGKKTFEDKTEVIVHGLITAEKTLKSLKK